MESPFDLPFQSTIVMYLEPVLNPYYKTYQNIITLSAMPAGPLGDMVKQINPPKLSPFQSYSAFTLPPVGGFPGSGCVYALFRYPISKGYWSAKYSNIHMGVDDIPSVLNYLRHHGYVIETEMTKMFFKSDVKMGGVAETRLSGNRRMICAFSYSPPNIVS